MKSGAVIIPHPEKAYKGGEDALAVHERMITVADGVGGWANEGVDVAKYSKQLMRFISEGYSKMLIESPKSVLTNAWRRTTETGSSTAVIAILDPQAKVLKTTNLGDSGYLLLRPHLSSDDSESKSNLWYNMTKLLSELSLTQFV